MIFNSPHADAQIPNMPLTPYVLKRMQGFGEKPAIIDAETGRCLTYTQLLEAIPRAASGLHRLGIRKGDIFAIHLPNVPEYPAVFHAASLLGGIITTTHPRCSAMELKRQLGDTRAKYLITLPEYLDCVHEVAGETKLQQIIVLGEGEGAILYNDILEGDGVIPEVDMDPRRDLAVIPFSSGTSGSPKGVMLTHHNIVANICQTEGIEEISAEDVLDGILPFCHLYGMQVIMNSGLALGVTVVTLSRFNFTQYLQLLQEYQVTRSYIVPSIIHSLANDPAVEAYDLSHLRYLISGAAPLRKQTRQRCAERLGCIIKQGYGLTETSPSTHVDYDEPERIRPDSVGPPVRSTECQIIGLLSGQPLAAGEVGEVLVRGPQVMRGYLNDARDPTGG